MPTEWFHELNDSQKEAVAVALNPQRPMVTIQGPPGTGKTFVVAEIIRQCAVRGQKVLVCAPSHVAVDNIIDRVKGKVKLVRLGTGVSESSQAFSFDAMVKQGSHAQDHQKAYETLQKLRESNAERNLLASVQSSVAAIATKARREVLNDAQAIFCTITSSMIEMLIALNIQPDVVIIDEAAQAIEPTSWLPLLAGKRCVLAGDQCQLPPIVMSQLAKDGRLHLSLMERLSAQFASISRLLTVQYRMHEKIMEWSSGYFYGGKLTAAASVGRATLSQISQVPDESIHNSPLLFIDTTGYKNGEMREVKSQGGTSSGNPGEARLVAAYLSKLIACGVKQQDIGIITPYVFQVALIKQLVNERYPDVMVDTVDSFQGQERQVIILSLVRSNPKRIVGFLNDDRRMNVSVTRAKRHLVMIGDSRTVVRSDAIAELIDVVSKSGKVQRASEYEADLQLINFSDSEVKKISSKVVGSEREALLETDSVDDAVGNRRSADAARRAVKM
uniref:Uncharacterized protein n=1 Tax=Plectus sambesii TaxID=2011161 RepID=A0A914X5R3_9BILA